MKASLGGLSERVYDIEDGDRPDPARAKARSVDQLLRRHGGTVVLSNQPLAVNLDHRERQAEGQHGAILQGEIRKPRTEQDVRSDRDGLLVAHLCLDARRKLGEIGAHAFRAGKELGGRSEQHRILGIESDELVGVAGIVDLLPLRSNRGSVLSWPGLRRLDQKQQGYERNYRDKPMHQLPPCSDRPHTPEGNSNSKYKRGCPMPERTQFLKGLEAWIRGDSRFRLRSAMG